MIPCQRSRSGRKASIATTTATRIASPPSSGVDGRPRLRSVVRATAPKRTAKPPASGVSAAAIPNATMPASAASPFMAREPTGRSGGDALDEGVRGGAPGGPGGQPRAAQQRVQLGLGALAAALALGEHLEVLEGDELVG